VIAEELLWSKSFQILEDVSVVFIQKNGDERHLAPFHSGSR
jgi:hypothetical protein